MSNNEGKKLNVNCETGEISYDDYTPEEIAQQLTKGEENKSNIKKAKDLIAAKASAQAKLAALGLTADEVTAIIGA